MHRYYDIPLVILFIDTFDQITEKKYEKISNMFHNHFFFTYIDQNILKGHYPLI